MQAIEPSRRRGLTILEVLVVLAIVAILGGLLLPIVSAPRGTSKRIACMRNLKNVGLAMRIFAQEHGTGLPMNLPANQGGTRELTGDVIQLWRHYLPFTNELTNPKILWCPSDSQRKPATRWAPDAADRRAVVFAGNQNLSYFLGLNAHETQPQTILAGDRNLTTNGLAIGPGRHVVSANTRLGFAETMHKSAGNILLADGSVQQVTSGRLNEQFQSGLTNSGLTTNVWLVP
ncbi:MAG: type II secretion system protein [Verrucomicrobia bacterium]|nr:type II secretion system protein [Verrucomicrobiota bacterium]